MKPPIISSNHLKGWICNQVMECYIYGSEVVTGLFVVNDNSDSSGNIDTITYFCSASHCMCPAENAGCRDQPFTILYRDMDVSGRTVPSDIFQMQATSRYPGAYYIFQIKSGNEGREFYMRVSGILQQDLTLIN